MKKIIVSIAIFIFLLTASSFAETSIKADVDKLSLNTDETLTYKITIASSDKKLPAPQLPEFEGLNVVSQAQSSTVSFVKGDIKTILVYAFILVPSEVGKFKIDPATIKIRGKTYSTDSFEIEVSQGKIRPGVPKEEKPALPGESLPESKEPQITL